MSNHTRIGFLTLNVLATCPSADYNEQMVNHESGLLDVSEVSSDTRDLISKESIDIRAALSVLEMIEPNYV